MLKATLGIGPMSTEIIEAVFRYSNYNRKELMLIASKNQIDHSGGYVNNFTTEEYMNFIKKMKQTYPQSNVKICRDHCGPGFNNNFDLIDTYKTIESDIKLGFDLIHIDFCHFKGTKEQRFEESKKAIQLCQKLNPNILLEVGTDENTGENYGIMNLKEIDEEIKFFQMFCKPEFYVVQTGSLVKEINQVGNFNKQFTKEIVSLLKTKNLKLKEHNADYLSNEEIEKRYGVVDAMNIAPQLGAVQTQVIISKCLTYGIPFENFINQVYEGKKWEKWLNKNTFENKFLCSTIAGHYHFNSDNYKNIILQLQKHEDINDTIINAAMEVIEHYDRLQ